MLQNLVNSLIKNHKNFVLEKKIKKQNALRCFSIPGCKTQRNGNSLHQKNGKRHSGQIH